MSCSKFKAENPFHSIATFVVKYLPKVELLSYKRDKRNVPVCHSFLSARYTFESTKWAYMTDYKNFCDHPQIALLMFNAPCLVIADYR